MSEPKVGRPDLEFLDDYWRMHSKNNPEGKDRTLLETEQYGYQVVLYALFLEKCLDVKGQWTADPPTVEGWYWVRFGGDAVDCPAKFCLWGDAWAFDHVWGNHVGRGLWRDVQSFALRWSVPIAEPPK